MLAKILTGLLEQREFKAFTCKKNQFDLKSTAILIKLLRRPFPQNLHELRIISCTVRPQAMTSLLECIPETQLRRLTLVKAGIDTNTIGHIQELVARSRSLVELDISWNRLSPEDLRSLFATLAENRHLCSVNVSWNNIQVHKATNPMLDKQ
jgi:Ran GTPase-activating protein (RanGAP) involved in mRNA processing and transport